MIGFIKCFESPTHQLVIITTAQGYKTVWLMPADTTIESRIELAERCSIVTGNN